MLTTLRVHRDRDPACRSLLEALLCSPGLHALLVYRVAHRLWRWRLCLAARVLSHVVRMLTGVEIHPAARIGERCFIDHGQGVVIGETAVVGDDVVLYHGVTLGAVAPVEGLRHPSIGDRVVIGAHALVLGPIHVGSDSRIGAGTTVVRDVPRQSLVTGDAGRARSNIARRLPPIEFHI